MQYYRVNVEEGVECRQGTFKYNRTEIMLAPSTEAIFEDCLVRFGDHLLSMDATEIDESEITSDVPVYVVI